MRTLLLVSNDQHLQESLEAGDWIVARPDGAQHALALVAELQVDGVVLDLRAPILVLAGALRARTRTPIIAVVPSLTDPDYSPARLAQAGIEDAVEAATFDAVVVGHVLEWAHARRAYCSAARRLKTVRRVVADLTEAVQRAQQVFVLAGNGNGTGVPARTTITSRA